jgi:hypothetical protein
MRYVFWLRALLPVNAHILGHALPAKHQLPWGQLAPYTGSSEKSAIFCSIRADSVLLQDQFVRNDRGCMSFLLEEDN